MRNDHAPTRMNCDMLCDDCAFPDTCAADDACTRARLARLNFEAAGSANTPSAIIEPPTKAELAGAPWPIGAIQQAVIIANGIAVAKLARTQIRAAIAEIEKAQAQITPAFEADEHLGAGPETIARIERQIRTAANVLEALPEAVAHAFGLTIRGACSFCHTTIFTADPKATDAEGRDVCEAHA